MKSFRSLRAFASFTAPPPSNSFLCNPTRIPRYFTALPEHEDNDGDVFDSSHYAIPGIDSDAASVSSSSSKSIPGEEPTWDEKYRERANKVIFGTEKQPQKVNLKTLHEEEEDMKRRVLARALLEAALKGDDEEEELVMEEDQKSLSVGIIGAPNAGKSSLTNYMVGTKVSAVSRKTNTTLHEVLGVMTKGDTQICFFDTPGLLLNNSRGSFAFKDVKARVHNAWSTIGLYDVLVVIFDVDRHLTRPDTRVIKLIQKLGEHNDTKQKRVLCMNKVDLVKKKKELLKVVDQFKDLPAYERQFLISGLKGVGVKDLTQYLMTKAVKRPWDEDPLELGEEHMKNISLEVVRERLLDHVHQEIPYSIEHRLVDWQELRDGSLRIEHHLITNKLSQRKILVGKGGSKIGRIGMEANEELKTMFKREIHLILKVKQTT
ncbi:GTP-binding protein ERG [Linum grandiflorum]